MQFTHLANFVFFLVALGVLDKTHYKRLGPDVKITLIDPFQPHKLMEQCSSTKKIMVTGITDKKFQNLKALKNYFESARQSGGGEPVIVEYLNGNAMITYKDLTGEFGVNNDNTMHMHQVINASNSNNIATYILTIIHQNNNLIFAQSTCILHLYISNNCMLLQLTQHCAACCLLVYIQ